MPQRIQRERTKGWKMPPNTVYVGRPTWFGNPFTPEQYWGAGYSGSLATATAACVQAYREWLTGARLTHDWRAPPHFKGWLEACREDRVKSIPSLRGNNLACWCKSGEPCHADVLLELANKDPLTAVHSTGAKT
jgi:hypothetical protein